MDLRDALSLNQEATFEIHFFYLGFLVSVDIPY